MAIDPEDFLPRQSATDAALAATAETGRAYSPAAGTPLSETVDTSSLYSPDGPTPEAAAYEAETTKTSKPANPRQADRVSDALGVGGKIARIAQQYVGTPYVWGGSTPDGFDCSGFVQYVFRKVGINLPRVSYQQAESGHYVSARQAKAGDLVSFDNSSRNNGADHIAIYLGGGLIAEAPRTGVPLRIRHLGDNEGATFTRVL